MIKITEYLLKHPRVSHMIVALLFLSGVFSSLNLQRQATPRISFDIMQITTVYPGAGPEDVEINVTSKIESELLQVDNIKELTSMSMENVSIITAQIDSNAGDPMLTKSRVRDAVGRVADLPSGVTGKPIVDEFTTQNFPLMELAVNGDVPELVLRKYARDLETRLRDVSGVGRISKIGFRKREIRIEADIKKMERSRISFAQLMQAIRARNVRQSGGTIESFVSEKKIVTLAEYDKLGDVGDVIIRSNFSGNRLKVSDIALVRDDFVESRTLYRAAPAGKTSGTRSIALIVSSQENADELNISGELNKVLEDFRGDLPKGVSVDIIFDFSIYTRIMLDMVLYNGIFGFILVLLVMFVFLDIRSAFWAAFGIPFCIFGSLILFTVIGITLNQIALVTIILVLGIVVDDAIVIAERIYELKQRGMDNFNATVEGVRSMIKPLSAAIATTILAFAPMMFIGGLFGKFLFSIPIVVALLLGFSWIESLLFLPSHIKDTRPPAETPARARWVEFLKTHYERILARALNMRGYVVTGYIAVLVLVLTVCGLTLQFVLKDQDPDFFTVIIEAPGGTSLRKTSEMTGAVEKLISKGVPPKTLRSFTTQVGHHDSLGSNPGRYTNWAIVTVYLIPAAQRDITTESIMESFEKPLAKLKGEMGFQRLSIEPLGGGVNVGKAVEITYNSDNDEARNRFERETLEFLRSVKGVSNVESSNVPGKAELRLKLNYARLAQVGLTAMDVASTVRTAFDGTVVTSIRRGGEEIDYRVRLRNPREYRAENVLKIPVANAYGALVPLGYFARFEERPGPSVIHHDSGKRSVKITANVDAKVLTPKEINARLREKFGKRAGAIPDLTMKFGGQEEEMLVSFRGLYYALAVAVAGIYCLLVVLFDSYRQPFLIMAVVPFAAMGVFLTLLLHGMPITTVALIGLLGLIGVAVNDTIVMISHLNEHTAEHGFSPEVIARGAADRFRPVILTTLTTFAGLLPTSYGIGGDLPDIRPMVLTMAWGLIFTTLVTLGFIPMLYSLLERETKT